MNLRQLRKHIDTQYISYREWLKIIEVSDIKTLRYIQDEVMVNSKYAYRDEWLQEEEKEAILEAIMKIV